MRRTGTGMGLKGWAALALVIACAGCANYTLVKAGKAVPVGNAFLVDTDINWSKWEGDESETWTVDGPQLQRLMFYRGIQDGKPLFTAQGQDVATLPLYRASMTPLEIQELYVATLAKSGGHQITTADLRPHKFGALDGFRFEFTFLTKDGLKYSGFVVGAQRYGTLLALVYTGTSLYHFQKHLQDVENILSSLKIL